MLNSTLPDDCCWWWTKARHLFSSCTAMSRPTRPQEGADIRPRLPAASAADTGPFQGRGSGKKAPPDDFRLGTPALGAGARVWPGAQQVIPSDGRARSGCGGAPQLRARSTTCSGRSSVRAERQERLLVTRSPSGWPRISPDYLAENGVDPLICTGDPTRCERLKCIQEILRNGLFDALLVSPARRRPRPAEVFSGGHSRCGQEGFLRAVALS